ncbi:MAG: fasciclin domain-containing protein [Bacteroidales bacterium]|nr:fasciclin domain-containing protein [Bacteroidales bacterium]
MKKKLFNILYAMLLAVAVAPFASCDDDPDSENYYTFTGQMMSDYLTQNEEYSQFAEVVSRAGLMNLLSTYGHFTCFCPANDAMETFLAAKGKTVATLTDAECDTIARTHLISVMYSTFEMKDGVLATQNMMRRPLKVSHAIDADTNSVVVINGYATIIAKTQNDSVENGIMHPIDCVLESSTNTLSDLIAENPRVSIYSEALDKTGLAEVMKIYKDGDYEPSGETYYYTSGAEPKEFATNPDERLIGYTAFLVPDSVLKAKYGITDLRGLYDLACKIYDPIYPNDVAAEGHSFEHLSDSVNPLRRFIAYHVLTRNIQGLSELTVRDDFGVYTSKMNPVDWYPTLLPYTMLKCEHLTVTKWTGEGTRTHYYLNRRYDDQYTIEGVHIQPDVESDVDNMALNGPYYYIDDIVKFDDETRDVIDNCRMRIDFSSLFPELMSNAIRMNGDRTNGGTGGNTAADNESTKYGRNFFFPDGYLEGVTVGKNGYFIYRRPRQGYWSLHGDEFVCQGNFDVTFRIPPVPFESEWQIRLGYAAMNGRRGVAQVYFDGVAQGIPLDMNRDLKYILYGSFDASFTGLNSLSESQRIENKKTLKNKGYYYGCNGGYHGANASSGESFADVYATLRIVLCTVHIAPGEDHYLRVRAVSDNKGSNNNEAMLDYLELVPKSVYGVNDEGAEEDDL